MGLKFTVNHSAVYNSIYLEIDVILNIGGEYC